MDSAEDGARNLEVAPSKLSRAEWDLMERVAELEGQLAERVERERVREIEISSLRHELELRFEHNSSLDRSLREARQRVEWMQSHIDHITRVFATESANSQTALVSERRRADDESQARRQAEEALAAERARIAYRLFQRLVGPFARRRPRGA